MLIDGSPVRTPERAAGPKRDLDAPASVVHEYIAPAPGRHVPHMLLATTIVAVLPLAVSLALRATGAVSGWVSVGLAVAMSLMSSIAGSAYWRKRGGHSEVLFGELLLWGWIRSWRQERELANATRLLGLVNRDPAHAEERDELSVDEREHLLRQLAGAVEGQDVYLNGHSRRVARHATMIARGMGLPSEEVARIRAAAAVHDVGKLRTPKTILNKPGRLTDAEFEVIKRHPVDGAEMVAALGDPELTRIVRHHHERLDGAGYPDRLEGEAIPVGARIIAVADTFDAITSARPYRDAAPHQKAIDILRKESGTQLDPEAVRAFLAYYSGSRPTVVWAVITSSVRRLVSWLTGDPAAAATISASKVAAATAATAAIGAAAAAAPVPVPVVHHHPARSAVVRSVPVRAHGAATALRRHGVSVVVPAATPAPANHAHAHAHARPAAKAVPVKTRRRRATQGTAPNRNHAKPSAGTQAHSRAAGAGTSSPSGTRGVDRSRAGRGCNPRRRTTQTTVTPAGQSPGNSAVSTASPPPSNPAPASHSEGNANAYGHTKVLGNGHGNGLAKGHGNSTPAPTPPSSAVPSTPVPVVVPAPSSTDGHGNGNSHGEDHGNGNGNGHSSDNNQGGTTAVVTPSPSPAPSVSVSTGSDGSDNGNGQGNGNSNGQGHEGAATATATTARSPRYRRWSRALARRPASGRRRSSARSASAASPAAPRRRRCRARTTAGSSEKPTGASRSTPSVPRKSRSPSARTGPERTSMPSEVDTARRVTPAQATSASSSMSPEQSSEPSPPVAG